MFSRRTNRNHLKIILKISPIIWSSEASLMIILHNQSAEKKFLRLFFATTSTVASYCSDVFFRCSRVQVRDYLFPDKNS